MQYQAQGRHDDAGPLLKRALAIRQKAFGITHPSVASVRWNLKAAEQALKDSGNGLHRKQQDDAPRRVAAE